MNANYKQLAEDLYDALKRVRCFSICNSEIDDVLQKYEDETTKGTGRTTALYMKAIAEALASPGQMVEFLDHLPNDFGSALSHQNSLRNIVSKLGYDIEVLVSCSPEGERSKVILVNRFNND